MIVSAVSHDNREVICVKRRILLLLLIFLFPVQPVEAEPIRWVDFSVPYKSLKYALDTDIATAEQEQHLGWIQTLALEGCRTGESAP